MKKATAGLADMHYGDLAQLWETLHECVDRMIQAVIAFDPDECEVLIDGDPVAGRGIYRNQELQNGLQFGSDQCWQAAHDIRKWDRTLRSGGVVPTWRFVLGNHDNSKGENLTVQLVMLLRLMGINATYQGRTYTVNLAGSGPACWLEAEHGYGNSDYYPNSYGEIRGVMRKHIERIKADHIDLSRVLFGHTHWLNIGQPVGHEFVIDTCGGWHRQERLKFGGESRRTGGLLYLHDGEHMEVRGVEANSDLLMDEAREVALHYKNMERSARALQAMTAWAHEQGLC